jgi:outer membrane protein assembly factor BamA
MKLQRGEFFVTMELREDTAVMEETYGELGYIEARVTARKQFLSPDAPIPAWAKGLDGGAPSLLNVIFRIEEADQYRIGRVDIRGNRITQERIIRRELRFFPEQLLNMKAVTESQHRLTETQLFERVDIQPLGTAPNERNVLVQIKEGHTGQIMLGAGISTNSGLLGNVAYTERNFDITRFPRSWSDMFSGRAFKGAGQTLRVVAEPGLELMRFHVDWFEPRLFDQPYSLGTKAFLFTRGRENYDETRYGGVVSVGHRFRNRWYGEVSSRVEGVRIHNLDSDAPPEVRSDSGTHALVGVKGTLIRDRTDSRWQPSRGDRFNLSYEQVFGSYDFGRATGDYRIYRTLYVDALDRKHIIAARVAAGSIFGDAPVFERFYGGGIGSVRGFEYRGISPRSTGTDEPIGGDLFVFAGTEYSFPIVGEQLRGVVFLDTGTVENSCEMTDYRVSAGVGLRWYIPLFGPIPMSLDFGFPISRDGDDEEQLINFAFGWTF